jgi:hypothetical protein
MAKDKKGFILYADQKELFEQLPDEKAGQLIKFIMKYVNDENPSTDDLIINLAFTPIKQQLKRDLQKFEQTKVNRSIAGKAGADKRWQNVANDSKRISTIAKMAVNDNVNVNDKVILSISERKMNFANQLSIYKKDYSKDILNEFYLYWTEHGVNDKKMRFEKQTSFDISRRLNNWLKNSAKFDTKESVNDDYMNHVMKQINLNK